MATFFYLQGDRCREVQLHVASDKLYKTIWQNSMRYAGNQPGICEVIHFGCNACILILLKICKQFKNYAFWKPILSINDLTSITSYLVIAPTSVVSTYARASRPRPQDLRFSIHNEVRFQNEMSYKNENFIWNENRNEPIPEWLNVREKKFVRVSCEHTQRNIWRWNGLVPEWESWFRIYTAGEDNAISTYQNMKEWMECMKNLSLELLLKNKNLAKKNIKQLRNIIDTKSSWT